MRATRRVSLFEREIRVRLGQAALELFFASASVLSEGRAAEGVYFGSTMLTVDLARLSNHLREACDLATARSTEHLLVRDPRVHDRSRAIAVAEASRLAGCEILAPWVDIKIRRAARHFYIDIDVEARLARPLADPSPDRRSPGRDA